MGQSRCLNCQGNCIFCSLWSKSGIAGPKNAKIQKFYRICLMRFFSNFIQKEIKVTAF